VSKKRPPKPSAPATSAEKPTENIAKAPTKTPMYSAMNSSRYLRQDLIKVINTKEGTNLLCYVCHPDALIDRYDIIGFTEMLHNVTENSPIDLMLNTGGGDVDACDKLVHLILSRVGNQRFRVIIPDFAKSAGTLMALAANKIVMSDVSELGMIDPQFPMKDGHGHEFMLSIMAYLGAFEEHSAAHRRNPTDPVALLMMDRFDPRLVRKFEGIRDRVRTFAEDRLKRHGAPASSISQELLDSTRWRTHNQPIWHADGTQIGLPIEYISPFDERWQRYWNLYIQQRYCLDCLRDEGAIKIYESAYASQIV
jgi:ATP-dependent protease ClpP protease subunit